MRILCLGGGPAGLYFALLMKLQNPAHVVSVVERNKPFDTFGWGRSEERSCRERV